MKRIAFLPKISVALASLLVVVVPSTAVFGQDRVFPKKGVVAIGTIKEVTRDKVVIEVRGTDQSFPANEILKLGYDDEPSTMGRARDLTNQGQYEQAADELKKIAPEALKTDPMMLEHGFYTALCKGRLALIGKGDRAAAVTALLAAAKADANSYHFWDISEVLGELATAMGKYDAALNYFKKMGEAPFPEYKTRAKYREGLALLAQAKPGDAKAALQSVLGANATTPEEVKVKQLAEVALALAESEEGQAEASLGKLNKLVQEGDATNVDLFARIYNAQGACLRKLNRPLEAALAYLHTDLLFFSEPEAHAEALYYLSQLWRDLNEAQRASDAKARLTNLYAGSIWASR